MTEEKQIELLNQLRGELIFKRHAFGVRDLGVGKYGDGLPVLVVSPYGVEVVAESTGFRIIWPGQIFLRHLPMNMAADILENHME